MIQNLYNLSDMATIAEIIDSQTFANFRVVESSNQIADGDTLERFCNLPIATALVCIGRGCADVTESEEGHDCGLSFD